MKKSKMKSSKFETLNKNCIENTLMCPNNINKNFQQKAIIDLIGKVF